MRFDPPGEGVERLWCGFCGGYDDVLSGGDVVAAVHRDDCPGRRPCECGLLSCAECVDAHEGEVDFEAVALALRLVLAAVECDLDAAAIALREMPACQSCERVVWLSVLQVVGGYGTEQFAHVLRKDLLGILDAAAEEKAQDG